MKEIGYACCCHDGDGGGELTGISHLVYICSAEGMRGLFAPDVMLTFQRIFQTLLKSNLDALGD